MFPGINQFYKLASTVITCKNTYPWESKHSSSLAVCVHELQLATYTPAEHNRHSLYVPVPALEGLSAQEQTCVCHKQDTQFFPRLSQHAARYPHQQPGHLSYQGKFHSPTQSCQLTGVEHVCLIHRPACCGAHIKLHFISTVQPRVKLPSILFIVVTKK